MGLNSTQEISSWKKNYSNTYKNYLAQTSSLCATQQLGNCNNFNPSALKNSTILLLWKCHEKCGNQ